MPWLSHGKYVTTIYDFTWIFREDSVSVEFAFKYSIGENKNKNFVEFAQTVSMNAETLLYISRN